MNLLGNNQPPPRGLSDKTDTIIHEHKRAYFQGNLTDTSHPFSLPATVACPLGPPTFPATNVLTRFTVPHVNFLLWRQPEIQSENGYLLTVTTL